MEKLSIARFTELIQDRIARPEAYKNNTLILWDGDYMPDGIPWEIIEDVCLEYNKTHIGEQGAWPLLVNGDFMDIDLTEPRSFCDYSDEHLYGYKNRGIMFVTTDLCMPDDTENIRKFLNTHINRKGVASKHWPMVACVFSSSGLTPDMFGPNCEICELNPDVEEWGEFMMTHYGEVSKPAIAYVREHGFGMRILGWILAVKGLYFATYEEGITPAQLSKKDFDMAVMDVSVPGCSAVMEDFYQFLHRKE